MKYLPIIWLMLFAGCASLPAPTTPDRVRIVEPTASVGAEWLPATIRLRGVPELSTLIVQLQIECVPGPRGLERRVELHAVPGTDEITHELSVPRCPGGAIPQLEATILVAITLCDPATPFGHLEGGRLVVDATLACDGPEVSVPQPPSDPPT